MCKYLISIYSFIPSGNTFTVIVGLFNFALYLASHDFIITF